MNAVTTIRPTDSNLRLASLGVALANEVLEALKHTESVQIDLELVESMSPSFANAFVMTLLESTPLSVLQSRCVFANRSDAVVAAMNSAVRRHQAGIRLTTQRSPEATLA